MSRQTVIENPILNSPFAAPSRHFRFDDDGSTSDIVKFRLVSSFFVPIAKARKKGKQLALDSESTRDGVEENKLINDIRGWEELWRLGGYAGVTATTLKLLHYSTDPEWEKRLFFCQIAGIRNIDLHHGSHEEVRQSPILPPRGRHEPFALCSDFQLKMVRLAT